MNADTVVAIWKIRANSGMPVQIQSEIKVGFSFCFDVSALRNAGLTFFIVVSIGRIPGGRHFLSLFAQVSGRYSHVRGKRGKISSQFQGIG